MTINLKGGIFNDAGTAVDGVTVKVLVNGDHSTQVGSTFTTSGGTGIWYFDDVADGNYDIEITKGSSVRYIRWDDQISLKEINVRNNDANTTPAATFTNITNNAANTVAHFSSLRGTGADNDEMYIRYYMDDASSNTTEVARMTVKLISANATSEDSEIRWGVAVGGSIVDVMTVSNTDGGATNLTLDVAGDLVLDADGGDVFFKDGGTTFGSATNNSGNLILKSGTTTAATFSGANVTLAGTVTATTNFTLGDTVITDGVITDTSGLSIVANTGVTGTLSASGLISANGGITFAAGDDIAFTGTTGTNDIVLTNGLADALSITDGSADVLVIDTSTSGNVITASSALTVGVDDTGHDVKFFGATAGSFLLWDESDDALELTDSSPIKIGDGGDMTIYHDGSNSYITNATGALKLATETEGIVVTIGHSTSEVTVGDNLIVIGDLTVSGTTTTLNTATLTIEDPLVKYGQAYTGSAVDQGFIVTRGNGSASNTQNMAFIWDESADQFAAIKAATEDGATAGNVTVTDYVDLHVGTLVADDAITIGGTNVVTGSLITTLSTISAGVWNGTPIATAYVADNAITLDKLAGIAAGKIIYGDASGNPAVLTKATDGDVLTLASGLPSWATPTTGDITSIVAGTGLTGSSLTSGAATLTIVGGDGITANADDVAITAAQTTITSVYNAGLKMGRDADNLIDFGTADNVVTLRVAGTDEVAVIANVLQPTTNDGVALGTTALGWSDLHLATGGVINWANGEMTLTEGDANTLTIAGGTFATAALTTSTIVASGIVKTDDTTNATSTTDGSLQTDGGLSVVLDAVFGDDVSLLTDDAVLALGVGKDATITHDGTTGATISGTPMVYQSLAASSLASDTHAGIVLEFLAGESIAVGNWVYMSTVDGRVSIADANDTADDGHYPAIGVAVSAQGSAGSAVKILTHGVYNDSDASSFGDSDLTEGKVLFLAEAPGEITATAPSDDGDMVQVCGIAIGPRDVFVNPSLDVVEHA